MLLANGMTLEIWEHETHVDIVRNTVRPHLVQAVIQFAFREKIGKNLRNCYVIRYVLLWYRAKTYCPVIDSLRIESEMWVDGSAYRAHKNKDWVKRHKYDNAPYYNITYSSLYHKELDIEITYGEYEVFAKEVRRNGHLLPVHNGRLRRALKDRRQAAASKILEAAKAELNRVTQDAQTLRLARIVQLRKELAQQEAADFAHRIEHG